MSEQERQQAGTTQQAAAASREPLQPRPCVRSTTISDLLCQLAFSPEQDAVIERITGAEAAEREQVLERLLEHALIPLIAAEAEKVLGEMERSAG